MTPEIIATYVTLLTTNIISPVISWKLAKKKYGAEVDNQVIDNMKESLEFYKRLSDDNKERLDRVLEENVKLREQMADLRKQVVTLSMIVASYGLTEKSNISYGSKESIDKTEGPS